MQLITPGSHAAFLSEVVWIKLTVPAWFPTAYPMLNYLELSVAEQNSIYSNLEFKYNVDFIILLIYLKSN